jgi:pimeloyl-ACP methyl ester carboxylesterase
MGPIVPGVERDGSSNGTSFAQCGPVRLAYGTFGSPDDPPLLLVMGLGGQMIAWPAEFCVALAERGRYVIRFDNRDAGESTHYDGLPGSPVATWFGRSPGYRIADLARDTIGLIETVAPEGVDIVGISMGGMISQSVAAMRPDLVHSLTSMSSTTGSSRAGKARLSLVMRTLLTRPVATKDARVEQAIGMMRALHGPAYPFDAESARLLASASYDRGYDAAATTRQLCAVIAAPDRTAALSRLRIPTLVTHGDADPLINVSGGRATAAAVPGATLIVFPGVGHELPRPLWPRLADEVAAVAARGDATRTGARGSARSPRHRSAT